MGCYTKVDIFFSDFYLNCVSLSLFECISSSIVAVFYIDTVQNIYSGNIQNDSANKI